MQPPTALIVDDDPDFRSALGCVLDNEGYRVVEAGNGSEAVDVLAASIPDVILVDLLMPVMSGWALFEWIEGRPELRTTPVIFLSGVPEMAPGGGSMVVKKPLDLPSLLRLLEELRAALAGSDTRIKAEDCAASSHRLRPSKRKH